jgi:hypothetical protein
MAIAGRELGKIRPEHGIRPHSLNQGPEGEQASDVTDAVLGIGKTLLRRLDPAKEAAAWSA